MIKLYQLLRFIEPKEWPQLQAFLESPYFNTKNSLLALAQELKPYYPNFESVDKSGLITDHCPEERPHRQFINEQYSALSRLVEQFLVQQALNRQKVAYSQLQLHAYASRKMPQHFLKIFYMMTKSLERLHPLHWEDTHYLWSAYQNLHNYAEAAHLFTATEKKQVPIAYLDEYFIMVELRHIVNLHSEKAFFKAEEAPIPFYKAIREVAAAHYGDHPIIQLYLLIVSLFEEWDEDRFFATETLYQQVFTKLETGEQYTLLLTLVNLINQRINRGQTELIKNMFQLYQHAVNKHLFTTYEQLTTDTFLNICQVASFQGASQWTDNFIQNHQHLIKDKEAETIIHMGQAIALFNSGNHSDAYDLIQVTDSYDLKLKLRIRTLTVRCLLELHLKNTSYNRVLLSTTANFNQFLSRNREQFTSATLQSYRNFNQAIIKIATIRLYDWNDQKQRQELKNYIQLLTPLVTKSWLLGKLD